MPFGVPYFQATKQTPNEQITDPSQSSIFTEYISNAPSYDIEVECTLYNCKYPFFVGIMFNRARWIAADPERIWQYRLVGLYGKQSSPNDTTSQTIELGFAQANHFD